MTAGPLCSLKCVSWIQTGSGRSNVFSAGFLKGFLSYTCCAPYSLSLSIWGCKDRKNFDLNLYCSSWHPSRFLGTFCVCQQDISIISVTGCLWQGLISYPCSPSLGFPICRINSAESIRSTPSYQISPGSEWRSSRAECKRSDSMCYISDNSKTLILAPSSLRATVC